MLTNQDYTFSVAPMMDWTDRHCRYFHRLIAPDAYLYTEMITSGAIKHGDRDRLLGFHQAERPVALQLGGSDVDELSEAAVIGSQAGYDEINLNVGCPSDRVQSGRFGACLMREPELVCSLVSAMRGEVDIPVTVKSRVGVDDDQGFGPLDRFVTTVARSACDTFIVHARNAWLSGLSPKENRTIPPLHYELVYELKQKYPEFTVVINGGITDANAVESHLLHVDGVMLGRAAYQNPWLLHDIQQRLFPERATDNTREAVIAGMTRYLEKLERTPVKHVTRHMLGLFHAQPGGKHWRRYLSQHAHRKESGPDILHLALEQMRPATRAS